MNALDGAPSYGCPQAASDMEETALRGWFTGADDMAIKLWIENSTSDTGEAHFQVKNWRYSNYGHGDGQGTFNGNGSWEYQPRSGIDGMEIKLNFAKGPAPGSPDPVSFLIVGGDRTHPVLFEDVDPDTCPHIVMKKETKHPR
ncbi:hypothetical protein HUT19_00625 [Streptomyces sp. NA02950]|uniref:hypothetical protein n=1 Tax=Streptomyces sp. NA02950 TaxID=2742137 RepID=UPI001591D549|nr:hypothetical protein [Streptomyces sp. NA02950]QKV90472.1 hypothetical protein HUT19_00625 [Streptomyces sp. NA02950]